MKRQCDFCQATVFLPCMNTRDVEGFAVGDRRGERGKRCLDWLKRNPDKGEKGYRRIKEMIDAIDHNPLS